MDFQRKRKAATCDKNTLLPVRRYTPGERICPARSGMTLKEELFVRSICCYPSEPTFDNMCESMRKAGYKGRHIGSAAMVLMKKPKIKEAIDKYRAKIMAEFDIAPRKVLQEIAASAFSNFQDFYSDDGTLKNLKDLPRHVSSALHDVEVKVSVEDGQPYAIQKVRLHDKLKALEMLGKHHKLFSENVNVNFSDPQSADEKAAAAHAALLSQLGETQEDGE